MKIKLGKDLIQNGWKPGQCIYCNQKAHAGCNDCVSYLNGTFQVEIKINTSIFCENHNHHLGGHSSRLRYKLLEKNTGWQRQ